MITIQTENLKARPGIDWFLSKFCENSCHYCLSEDYKTSINKKGNYVHYSDEELEIHDHISNLLLEVIVDGHISLLGGEPTLHPKGIEYFNKFCNALRDNKNTTVYLITHGEIDGDKIYSIDHGGKEEHMISISYHYYQADFDNWFAKVHKFNESHNIIVSAILPRRPKVWDQFEDNINVVMDAGIKIEVKPEIHNVTDDVDVISLARFEDLMNRISQNRTKSNFHDVHDIQRVIVSGGEDIPNGRVSPNIPLSPGKTFCSTPNFKIIDNVLMHACSDYDSPRLSIDTNTTAEQMLVFMNNFKTFKCMHDHCTEIRCSAVDIKILS